MLKLFSLFGDPLSIKVYVVHIDKHTHSPKGEKQEDRQTKKERNRQTKKQTDIQTKRQTNMYTYNESNI
jgi:hypothetical protein